MKKWIMLVAGVLPKGYVEEEQRVIHHWPFSRWYHCMLVSLVATLLAPRYLRREAAIAALVHDKDDALVVNKVNSWKTFKRYWLYLMQANRPLEPTRFAATTIGMRQPITEGIRNHMKKYNPLMWFENPATLILMAADVIGNMLEYILFPWMHKIMKKGGR
jgi:hypothetical protein